MIFLNGKIHLFTKEWKSKSVSHYIMHPTTETLQPAQKTESYQSDFVVTDATYYQGKLYLVGYNKGAKVYLLSCEETAPDCSLAGKYRSIFRNDHTLRTNRRANSYRRRFVYFRRAIQI